MTVLMMLLITQFAKYLTTEINSEMVLISPSFHDNFQKVSTDPTFRQKPLSNLILPKNHILSFIQINVSLEINFHRCPCELLTLTMNDLMGTDISDLFSQPELHRIRRFVTDVDSEEVEEYSYGQEESYDIIEIINQLN